MTRGRPRTPIGTFGVVALTDLGGRYRALTRFRDLDGRLRKVTATATTRRGAEALLKERLTQRAGHGSGGVLGVASGFDELCDLWLADLELRDISEGTKQNYRDDLRRNVRPSFESLALGEITTGRVEWFLRREAVVSYSRAKHSRTLLNQMFDFALRHDAIARNPVEGTSQLVRPKHEIQALTLEQVQAIRAAAAAWRAGPKANSTGQLELVVSGRYATYQGDRYRDTAKVSLEAKLERLFHKLEVYRRQAAAAAEQHGVCAEDRQRRWEAAMADARERYDGQARWEHFERISHQQREVAEHRAFLSDARAAAARYQGEAREAVIAQLDMAERVLGEMDPLRHPELLAPVVGEPQASDLKPFLDGWSPLGPGGS